MHQWVYSDDAIVGEALDCSSLLPLVRIQPAGFTAARSRLRGRKRQPAAALQSHDGIHLMAKFRGKRELTYAPTLPLSDSSLTHMP